MKNCLITINWGHNKVKIKLDHFSNNYFVESVDTLFFYSSFGKQLLANVYVLLQSIVKNVVEFFDGT